MTTDKLIDSIQKKIKILENIEISRKLQQQILDHLVQLDLSLGRGLIDFDYDQKVKVIKLLRSFPDGLGENLYYWRDSILSKLNR